MTLLDQITGALTSTGAVSNLMGGLSANESDTRSMIGAGVPAVLAGLGLHADGDGATALHGLVNDDGGDLFESAGSLFSQGDRSGMASQLVGSIFGKQRDEVESHISATSGSNMSAVSRLLPMLAPAVMSLLGTSVRADSLSADDLTEQLASIGADGPLGDILERSDDDDRAGFVSGLTSLREAGGLAALIPTNASAGAAAGASATGAAAATGVAATKQGVAAGAGHYDDDRDRTGLAWLLPFLAVAGLLILGLILWQCSSSEVRQPSIEVAAEPEPEAEPEAAPEPAPDPAPAPEPTATPEPEPTAVPPAPVVTIADLAAGSDDLSTLLGIAADLGLAEAIGDPDAGPFTVFAPTNDAFDNAQPVIERLDGDQVDTTVRYHVVEGVFTSEDVTPGARFETITGELLVVSSDGSLPGGVDIIAADLMADNGVVHIVDGVLVPGSVARGLATADLNALFALEPIQFAVSSAEILPESVPTLDNAIEVLTNVPEGTQLEVQGHTDSDGDAGFNQTLSEARAASVVEYLTNGGVDVDILIPVGYGETDLKIDPDVSPQDKAVNRRIEFVDNT